MAVAAYRSARPMTDADDSDRPMEPLAGGSDADTLTERSPEDGAQRPRWLVPTAIGLTALLTALLVVGITFGIRAASGFGVEHGRANVLDAGRQVALNLTTFDYSNAEADTQRLTDSTTPTFAAGFAGDRNAFVKSLRDGQVKMTGNVTEAGVLSYTGDTAHVIVAVKSQIVSTQSPQPQARDYRIDLSMTRQGGQWLATGAEFIS
jgi:Mce-associated membrane protein